MYQRLREALGSGGFLVLAAACLTAVAVAGWVLLVPAGTAPVTPEPIVRTEDPVPTALPAELPAEAPAEEPEPVAAPEPEPEPEPEPKPEPQPVPVVKAVSSVPDSMATT